MKICAELWLIFGGKGQEAIKEFAGLNGASFVERSWMEGIGFHDFYFMNKVS